MFIDITITNKLIRLFFINSSSIKLLEFIKLVKTSNVIRLNHKPVLLFTIDNLNQLLVDLLNNNRIDESIYLYSLNEDVFNIELDGQSYKLLLTIQYNYLINSTNRSYDSLFYLLSQLSINRIKLSSELCILLLDIFKTNPSLLSNNACKLLSDLFLSKESIEECIYNNMYNKSMNKLLVYIQPATVDLLIKVYNIMLLDNQHKQLLDHWTNVSNIIINHILSGHLVVNSVDEVASEIFDQVSTIDKKVDITIVTPNPIIRYIGLSLLSTGRLDEVYYLLSNQLSAYSEVDAASLSIGNRLGLLYNTITNVLSTNETVDEIELLYKPHITSDIFGLTLTLYIYNDFYNLTNQLWNYYISHHFDSATNSLPKKHTTFLVNVLDIMIVSIRNSFYDSFFRLLDHLLVFECDRETRPLINGIESQILIESNKCIVNSSTASQIASISQIAVSLHKPKAIIDLYNYLSVTNPQLLSNDFYSNYCIVCHNESLNKEIISLYDKLRQEQVIDLPSNVNLYVIKAYRQLHLYKNISKFVSTSIDKFNIQLTGELIIELFDSLIENKNYATAGNLIDQIFVEKPINKSASNKFKVKHYRIPDHIVGDDYDVILHKSLVVCAASRLSDTALNLFNMDITSRPLIAHQIISTSHEINYNLVIQSLSIASHSKFISKFIETVEYDRIPYVFTFPMLQNALISAALVEDVETCFYVINKSLSYGYVYNYQVIEDMINIANNNYNFKDESKILQFFIKFDSFKNIINKNTKISN